MSEYTHLQYLEDLLGYAKLRVDFGEPVPDSNDLDVVDVVADWFASDFHQPFDILIKDEHQTISNQPVQQIRIAVEILRTYLKTLPEPISTVDADSHYRLRAYQELLTNLGTSFDELRTVRSAGDEEELEEARSALAARLGIGRVERLDELFIEPADLTEAALERLFGLIDTTRDPFVPPQTQPALLIWRADHLRKRWKAEREPVQAEATGGVPIIDPDLISEQMIIDPEEVDTTTFIDSEIIDPSARNAPLDLWRSRKHDVDDIVTEVQTTIDDATTAQPTVLGAYDAVIEAILGPVNLETVLESRTEGALDHQSDATESLALLDLSALRRLVRLRTLATSGTLTESEWGDARAILIQFRKRQQFPAWKEEEQERGVFLSPDFFTLPDAPLPQPLPPWRAPRQARLDWEDTLQTRIEQLQAIQQALQTAIDATENVALIELRDALIAALAASESDAEPVEQPNPALLADQLTDRLLFDFKNRDDRETTRLEQATETLQGVFFVLRMGQSIDGEDLPDDNPPDWVLDQNGFTEADFDEDWQWMGTYATRRAAEFIKDHPENYLHPSFRDEDATGGRPPTETFWTLIDHLRARPQLTPTQARQLASEYLNGDGTDWIGLIDELADVDFLDQIETALENVLDADEPREPFELTEQLSNRDLVHRRDLVKQLFANQDIEAECPTGDCETDPIQNPHVAPIWLQEIFYFVPMAIALQLQRAGEYLAALEWYQTVYAYQFTNESDTAIDERKIYDGLELESVFSAKPSIFQLAWLREDLHPHYFARQRKYAYTRFTIISIAQCLLEYADSEFTAETDESLSRARTLYLTAVDLLDLSDMPDMPTENPIIESLRRHAEMHLDKLRSGRNIAGLEMPSKRAETDTLEDEINLPIIGSGGQLVARRSSFFQSTPYRYSALIERAKHLVTIAQQMEAAFLAALEKRDAETYNVLKADQDLQLSKAGVQLQKLRVDEAKGGVTLAKLQQDRAEIQSETYQDWIADGLNRWEETMIDKYREAGDARQQAAIMEAMAGMVSGWASIASAGPAAPVAAIGWMGSSALNMAATQATTEAIAAETRARIASIHASHARRKQQWELQQQLAEKDIEIGAQQITHAQDHVAVVTQEREIADVQADHAKATVDFLANKFLNAELYEWMSGVLGRVYSYFLQQATAMARLAQSQLAFQRQEPPPDYIRADYWKVSADPGTAPSSDDETPDRRGLTGSARLLQDIYQLDQYAFETKERKLQLTQTFSLAQLAPFEFQRFRETGVLPFATPMELFDQGFPGHYLRLIERVRTSVVALVPPTQGIRATLTTSGLSRVVTGGMGEAFRETVVRRDPEQVALTSPSNATGLLELEPEKQDLLLPFESMGVDTSWELEMPKAANPFDYDTIADVLITVEYTALNSPDYRQQVIQELDNSISADRQFSFRDEFADQWYDLNNPEQTDTPMTVQFETRREDFPPNLQDVDIQHVLLYVVGADDEEVEDGADEFEATDVAVNLQLTSHGDIVGGPATPLKNGVISTRRANGGNWTAMIGESSVGTWELSLTDPDHPDDPETVKNWFEDEQIEDILFVLTFEGRTPDWPA